MITRLEKIGAWGVVLGIALIFAAAVAQTFGVATPSPEWYYVALLVSLVFVPASVFVIGRLRAKTVLRVSKWMLCRGCHFDLSANIVRCDGTVACPECGRVDDIEVVTEYWFKMYGP